MASTIKVDNVQNQPGTNIINKCSTTITLGQSGDTISLASGASQTGFGRTGTVDWITTPKVTGDSPVTGVTGKGYFLNTTAGAITINLPAGAAGSIVSMADYAATWQTNNVTVSPNGTDKIGSLNENATLSTEGQSITLVYVDSTQGWINTMDSTSNIRGTPPFIVATGGTPCSGAIVCTNYKVHTFTGPGTFCVSNAGGGCNSKVAYLVVAGGGVGGNGPGQSGGGGGAGGFREGTTSPVVPYTASPLVAATGVTVSATSYPITVGGGGGPGTNGSDSIFSTITSTGGGKGGAQGSTPAAPNCGSPGGSGGGGGGEDASQGLGAGNTPPVSPAQGFPGGDGRCTGSCRAGGGGGGATVIGTAGAPPKVGGAGGAGATTSINNTPTAYAGGGGGIGQDGAAGSGGTGGGGTAATCGTAGTVNTGGGGGSGNGSSAPQAGSGGSGIVIIRYKFQ